MGPRTGRILDTTIDMNYGNATAGAGGPPAKKKNLPWPRPAVTGVCLQEKAMSAGILGRNERQCLVVVTAKDKKGN